MDAVMTESDWQRADAWDPVPRLFSRPGYVVFVLWTVFQPVLDVGVLHEPRIASTIQWLLGDALIFGAVVLRRYKDAAPYHFAISTIRSEAPDSLVYGIRLDPLTTPVGAEWGISSKIRWGLIAVSRHGVRIVRSDGVLMLDRTWSEFEFSVVGLDVVADGDVEEWWFTLLSESGIWPRPLVLSRNRNRFRRMTELRPAASSDSRDAPVP
jgi:hypothetical protein